MNIKNNKLSEEIQKYKKYIEESEELNKLLNIKLKNHEKDNNSNIKEIENQKNEILKELFEKEKINKNYINIQNDQESLNKKYQSIVNELSQEKESHLNDKDMLGKQND